MARRRERIALMSNSPGTERYLTVYRYGRAGARPKVYMQAAIHANELPGVMALHHLLPMLDKADALGRIKGEIVVVPSCNPIGFSQFMNAQHLGRYHFLGRDNFNRNHYDLSQEVAASVKDRLGRDAAANVALIRAAAIAAAKAIRPGSEIADWRRTLIGLSIDSDIVLDLHCDQIAALHLFISAKDIEPARALAADLGVEACMYNEPWPAALTFSGVNGALWPRLQEMFPDYPIPQACFSTTIEYRGQGDVTDQTGREDAASLYRFLVRRGVVRGKAGKPARLKCAITPIAGMDVGYAPRAGMLTYLKGPGARVRKGEVVCEIVDPLAGDPRKRVALKSATDGVLFSRRQNGLLVHPGMVLFRIAGEKRLRHRIGKSGLDD
ncbi:MAG: succinylglutamate desuccinylase/aspartoacylase family protein [Alphaproteobacteria bacterium]|nr:succinylglutamate desuccinylase/aspartoacylase family protein [Alphaproteobacteria bacterium]